MDIPVQIPPTSGPAARGSNAELRRVAEEFEASFLAEMLGHAGLGQTRETFGGGAGEDAFGSLLVREHARLLVERGGLGLAESVYEALVARQNRDST